MVVSVWARGGGGATGWKRRKHNNDSLATFARLLAWWRRTRCGGNEGGMAPSSQVGGGSGRRARIEDEEDIGKEAHPIDFRTEPWCRAVDLAVVEPSYIKAGSGGKGTWGRGSSSYRGGSHHSRTGRRRRWGKRCVCVCVKIGYMQECGRRKKIWSRVHYFRSKRLKNEWSLLFK
jgi:hypothetical protein